MSHIIFSEILIRNQKSLDLLYSKNHTQVGVVITGTDEGSPYFWCVLFGNGKPNSTFAFEGGVAKAAKPYCYSGANDECRGVHDWSPINVMWIFAASTLVAMGFAFPL